MLAVRLCVCWIIVSLCRADSCNGRCGQSHNPSASCQCNTACERFGDCCSDYSRCTEDSCNGRCGQTLDAAYNCQCNSHCQRYADCCSDYTSFCSGDTDISTGGGTDSLSNVMQDLWNADVNRFDTTDIVLNSAGTKLFVYVNQTRLSGPTYRAFTNLLDNYERYIGVQEIQPSANLQEIETFLDEILGTEVMTIAFAYLSSEGKIFPTQSVFRSTLKELWFNLYPRSSSLNFDDSSGFEHVMVGELNGGKVSGFHSWLQFYLQEKAGNLQFSSLVADKQPRMKGAAFTWYGGSKSKGSFFLGTSPEFDIALYSICALAHPNSLCRFTLEGFQVAIQTWDIGHKTGGQIGSAYPSI